MSTFIMEPTPLNDIANGKLTDLGGTSNTEGLQQSVSNDCRVNGIEFAAKAPEAPMPKAPEPPRTDFTNLIGSPKPNSLG